MPRIARKSTKTKTKTKTSQKGASDSKGLRQLAKMMRGIDLCMMTTRATGGVLRTRPMSNNGEVDFAGDAWFFSGRDTPKVKELAKDGAVSLSYVGGKKKKPLWIAIEGTAAIVDDAKKKRELWVKELDRWFDGGPEDPSIVLIHVTAKRASWWKHDEGATIELGPQK